MLVICSFMKLTKHIVFIFCLTSAILHLTHAQRCWLDYFHMFSHFHVKPDDYDNKVPKSEKAVPSEHFQQDGNDGFCPFEETMLYRKKDVIYNEWVHKKLTDDIHELNFRMRKIENYTNTEFEPKAFAYAGLGTFVFFLIFCVIVFPCILWWPMNKVEKQHAEYEELHQNSYENFQQLLDYEKLYLDQKNAEKRLSEKIDQLSNIILPALNTSTEPIHTENEVKQHLQQTLNEITENDPDNANITNTFTPEYVNQIVQHITKHPSLNRNLNYLQPDTLLKLVSDNNMFTHTAQSTSQTEFMKNRMGNITYNLKFQYN